uniref:Uncharacterized protein n=1 Tax=Klebsiella pneumoniae TaxID=573 RepID=A0A8B0T0G9_KLEPN|nr:hypothetical protein [Klebsiella pneumoniae]
MRSQLPAIACLVTVDSMQPRTFRVPAFGGTLRHAAHKVIVDRVGLNADGKITFRPGQYISCWPGGWISMVKPKPSRREINAGAELRSKKTR